MADALDGLTGRERKKKWRERSNQAEWDVPEGRLGSVIIQLRDRGQQSYSRAQLILYALLAVIFIGLGYYVVRPLLQDWSDGKRAIYREQISEGEVEHARLDQERTELQNRLVEDLNPAGVPARSGTQRNIDDILQIPGTPTLLAATARFTRGRDGSVIRSIDRGKSWETVTSVPDGLIVDLVHIAKTQIVVAVGQRGAIVLSEDNGENWKQIASGTKRHLLALLHIPKTKILIAIGQRGTLLRSEDNGQKWNPADTKWKSPASLIVHVPEADAVVVADDDGKIKRSINAGKTWKTVYHDDQREPLQPFALLHIPNSRTLMVVSDRGMILRSEDYGETWKVGRSGTQKVLTDLLYIPQKDVLLASGYSGTILKSEDRGKAWQPVEAGTAKQLLKLQFDPTSGAVFALGADGTVLKSHDYGETWVPIASGSGADFWYLIVDPKTNSTIAAGTNGAIIHITDELSSETKSIGLMNGRQGDQTLLEHFENLPPTIKKHPKLAPYNREFEALSRNRERTAEKLMTAHKALEEIGSGAYLVALKQEAFSEFMKNCRSDAGGDADGKVTQVCAAAFKDVLPNAAKSWWTTVAEEVPRGILLLFLLATLGTLYRYNLRLAAFHHSRADALELLSQDVTLEPEKLAILTDAMSAEKVEFGKANTPADQAADVAKAVINKVK